MSIIIGVISFFWLIRTLKAVLFWIYLWQLKEYHIWRFIDHFRTYKGRKIFLNWLFFAKLILLALLLISVEFTWVVLYLLFALYFVESMAFLYATTRNSIKRPVVTLKTALLIFLGALLAIGYLISIQIENQSVFVITVLILLFDIITPLIVSLLVLFLQPLFVVMRIRILKKAKDKIRQYQNLTIIAITGSYGKTSTKEFLTTILSSKFKVLSTKEHKNSEMGIAETILERLQADHQIFVVEMGAYRKDGINLLCDIVKPKIGLVTGVNEQHLATFGSMENLLSAEGGRELLNNLPQNGVIVINGDNKYCIDLYKRAEINKKIYSVEKKINADIIAEAITVYQDSIDFLAITKEKETAHFNVPILGKQNIQNLLGAILVAKELGMSLEEIAKASKFLLQKQAGITLKRGIYGINIIDASYSSNPDGVIADLDYLNAFNNKKMVIMPCLIELGEKSAEVHRQIGKKIAKTCNLAIITTKDRFKEIKEGALLEGMEEGSILLVEKSLDILHLITTFCKEEDAVLLEGRVPGGLIKLLSKK